MFNMKKRVKKYGNSLIITFDAEDQAIYGIVEGDVIDIGDMIIQKKEEKKHDKNISGSIEGKDSGGDNKNIQTSKEPTPGISNDLQQTKRNIFSPRFNR